MIMSELVSSLLSAKANKNSKIKETLSTEGEGRHVLRTCKLTFFCSLCFKLVDLHLLACVLSSC